VVGKVAGQVVEDTVADLWVRGGTIQLREWVVVAGVVWSAARVVVGLPSKSVSCFVSTNPSYRNSEKRRTIRAGHSSDEVQLIKERDIKWVKGMEEI
jgi:meiotically up-regulated gene 157 (Mug157) protein